MKIATSPFVYWGVAVFMPEKLGNLQTALCTTRYFDIKQKHTESLPCIQCIPWLTESIADRAGGLAALYSEESGANITSYLAAR